MFQLLVQYGGWDDSTDSIRSERMFEYTESYVEEQFLNHTLNQLYREKILNTPALFMEEGTDDNQIIKLGRITNIRLSNREYIIDYIFDTSFPLLHNNQIYSIKEKLDIHEYEFSRTHWSFKDVDLFKILYQSNCRMITTPSPTVFNIGQLHTVDSQLISIMMPFDLSFNEVHFSIKNEIESMGLILQRADNVWEHHTIIQDIITLICKSKIIIFDCTNKNPNVFYELGIAHSLGKETIIITQNEMDIPFDLRHHRYIKYLNNSEGRLNLVNQLKNRVEHLLTV